MDEQDRVAGYTDKDLKPDDLGPEAAGVLPRLSLFTFRPGVNLDEMVANAVQPK